MAQGRMLKKNVSISKKLASLKSDSTRLLWTWLLPHLDCEGRFSADPSIVRGHAVPRLKHFTDSFIAKCLKELDDVGLILLYEADGDRYLQCLQFDRHQGQLKKEREAPSQCPAPPPQVRTKSGEGPDKVGVNIMKCNGMYYSSTPLASVEPKSAILFDFHSKSWQGITQDDRKAWGEAYPACDVDTELARMREWILGAGAKGRKKQWRKFITNWLSRSQEKGGTQGVMRPKRDLAAETAALEKRYGGGR